MNLFAELRRRNVLRMAGLYLVGAWLIVQVSSTLLPTFDIPSWALRALIIVLAIGFVLRGDGDTALREAQLEPADAYSRFGLALAYFARGDRAAADAALAQMVAIDNTAAAFQIAQVYAFRGETDAAFQWLQHGYDIRDTGLLSISTDPLLRPLHSDPRFALMLGKMGLSTPAKPE